MSRFRVNRPALALAAALLPAAAMAQSTPPDGASGGPRVLGPAVPPPSTEPRDTRSWEQDGVQVIPGDSGRSAVEVGSLGGVDNSAVGLLDSANGGLGGDLWRGASRETVASLLPRLPMASASSAVNGLTRRLLLTTAAAPAGDWGTRSFIGMRLEKLADGGLNADLAALVSRMVEPNARARELRLESLLLEGKDADACGDASAERLQSNETYWLKVRALCYAVDGNLPGVSLTMELIRSQGVDEEMFLALGAQIAEATPAKIETYRDPTAIGLAMFRLAGAAVPAETLKMADPGELRSIALLHTASGDVQMAAAEMAAAIGVFDPAELAKLYAAVKFKAKLFDNVAKSAASLTTPSANALFYQAAGRPKDMGARAKALSAALDFARTQGAFPMLARVYAPLVREITPAPDYADHAGEFARALLYAGDVARAQDWAGVLETAGPREQAKAMQVLLAIADPTPGRAQLAQDAILALLAEAEHRGSGDPLMTRVELYAGLMDALGLQVPSDVRFKLLQGPLASTGAMPADMVMTGLDGAAAAGRVGETVLFALSALGQQGPGAAHPTAVIGAAGALKAVGLDADARALALEAMLARPFAPVP